MEIHKPKPWHGFLYDVLAGQQRLIVDEQSTWQEIDALLEQGDSAEDKRELRRLVILERDNVQRRRLNYSSIFRPLDQLKIRAQPMRASDQAVAGALCAPLAPRQAAISKAHSRWTSTNPSRGMAGASSWRNT